MGFFSKLASTPVGLIIPERDTTTTPRTLTRPVEDEEHEEVETETAQVEIPSDAKTIQDHYYEDTPHANVIYYVDDPSIPSYCVIWRKRSIWNRDEFPSRTDMIKFIKGLVSDGYVGYKIEIVDPHDEEYSDDDGDYYDGDIELFVANKKKATYTPTHGLPKE